MNVEKVKNKQFEQIIHSINSKIASELVEGLRTSFIFQCPDYLYGRIKSLYEQDGFKIWSDTRVFNPSGDHCSDRYLGF